MNISRHSCILKTRWRHFHILERILFPTSTFTFDVSVNGEYRVRAWKIRTRRQGDIDERLGWVVWG